jgi:hypothetical protein
MGGCAASDSRAATENGFRRRLFLTLGAWVRAPQRPSDGYLSREWT